MQTKRLLQFSLLLCLACLFVARSAFAADAPPPPDQDAAAWAKFLYAALTEKHWGVVTGALLIGLVYPLRRFGPEFLKGKLGGVALAFAISLAATFGATLAAGAHVTIGMALGALATAATAAGVWEWIKDLFPGAQAAAAKASSST